MSRTAARRTKNSRDQHVLRIIPSEGKPARDTTATHLIPSGLGGVFAVEVLQRNGHEAKVRIHMPGTEWHHWQGSFWVHDSELRPITA